MTTTCQVSFQQCSAYYSIDRFSGKNKNLAWMFYFVAKLLLLCLYFIWNVKMAVQWEQQIELSWKGVYLFICHICETCIFPSFSKMGFLGTLLPHLTFCFGFPGREQREKQTCGKSCNKPLIVMHALQTVWSTEHAWVIWQSAAWSTCLLKTATFSSFFHLFLIYFQLTTWHRLSQPKALDPTESCWVCVDLTKKHQTSDRGGRI